MDRSALPSQTAELHIKAKWYYSYDLYTDNGFGLRVMDETQSFDDFKSWIHVVLHASKTEPKKPSKSFHLVGSHWKAVHDVIASSEDSKKFIRSLIAAVQENMTDGHCFARFDKSNIVLTEKGEVRFKNIGIVHKNGPSKVLTYNDTISMIEALFEGKMPPDVEHLIDMMKKHGADEHKDKEMLYSVHPSIAASLGACWTFLELYEVLKFRILEPQRKTVYLELPYLFKWRTILTFNTVLQETYDHPLGNYEELTDGAAHTENERKIHEADKLMDFIRNGIAHRLQRTLKVSLEQHEAIIITSYPLLIPMLQEKMFQVLGQKEFAKQFGSRYAVKKVGMSS